MAKKLFLTPAVVKYNYNIFSIKQPWGGGGGEERGEGEEREEKGRCLLTFPT